MTMPNSDLAVRRHERYVCDFPAQVLVGPASTSTVRLSGSAVSASGAIPARITDFSAGGLGIQSPVFLPGTCQLHVRLTPSDPAIPSFQGTLRIQRAAMTDRKPSYYLGTSFDSAHPADAESLGRMLAWLKQSGAKLMPERARA
jgi:hypothetical protein